MESPLDRGTPWIMAQGSGMSDVAAVLARRTAELRRHDSEHSLQQASAWDELAKLWP